MSNPYFSDLLNYLDGRYSKDSVSMTYEQWISANTTLNGRPFTTKRYPFQGDIINDMHPQLAVKKISQVGLSEIQIRKALAFLHRNQGTKGMFSMPDINLMKKFSQTRVDPILNTDRAFNLKEWSSQVRSVDIKQVGLSYLYISNASESNATSNSIDMLCVDEVDLSDQAILALYESRMQNSDWRIRHDFSTPSFAGFGIDGLYEASDKREYLCQCTACNHWQLPVWDTSFVKIPGMPDNMQLIDLTEETAGGLDLLNAVVVCEACGEELDLENGKREWVAARMDPKIQIHGYQIRPFSTNRLGIQYIMSQQLKYQKRDFIRGFYNTVLGETYENSTNRLGEAEIKNCFRDQRDYEQEITSGIPIHIGIDMGLTAHYLISTGTLENLRILKVGTIGIQQLTSFIKDLIDNGANIIGGGVDRMPYTPTADALCEMTQGRIKPIHYTQGSGNITMKERSEAWEMHAQVNRTWVIDQAVKQIRKLGGVEINGYGPYQKTFIHHLQQMVRDETPEKPATWRKISEDDHFFHALVFLVTSYKIRQYQFALDEKHSDQRSLLMVGTFTQKGAVQTDVYGRLTR
jgi:Phage terminase large subunit (GpA)